jgi:glyoxylase-like metal-dependent hydrolase (beta-lactamase superfamily II)
VAEPGQWADVELVPPTRLFAQRLDIDLGGVTVELHALPGHTRDCIVGLVAARGLLLAGDTVETPCPVVPEGSPLADWVGRLRQWTRDVRVRFVVPAHGPVGGVELLSRNVEYLQGLLDGHPLEPPGPLTEFYQQTHRTNLTWRPPA